MFLLPFELPEGGVLRNALGEGHIVTFPGWFGISAKGPTRFLGITWMLDISFIFYVVRQINLFAHIVK